VEAYLRVVHERCTNALNILDRFHIVAKMNDALDDVRAAEARRLAQDGYEPVLKRPVVLLKRKPTSPPPNASGSATCCATTSRRCERTCSRRTSSNSGVRLTHLGRQIPRRVVPAGHALPASSR